MFISLKECARRSLLMTHAAAAVHHRAMTAVPDKMRAVIVDETGARGPESVRVGEVDTPTPGPGQLLVRVRATAVNRADTLQRRGLYPPPPGESYLLGLEAAGEVAATGPDCGLSYQVGDRVMCLLGGGGNAQFAAVHEGHVIPVPADMPFTEAAALPEAWLTAFQLLHMVAEVKQGDKVVVHAGGSGVGTALVQLVALAGATPIVTAGSTEKIELCERLGAARGFNYKQCEWRARLQEEVGSVQIVLDPVGARYFEDNLCVLATDGTLVLYSLLSGPKVEAGPWLRTLLSKRITVRASTLRSRSQQYKARLVSQFAQLMPHFLSRRLKPVIHTVMPLAHISRAHKLMETNLNTGKIVLTVD